MKPLAKLSLTRQRLYRKSCIGDNDIPFQETIVPLDLYEDHQGGGITHYFVHSALKICSKIVQFGVNPYSRIQYF